MAPVSPHHAFLALRVTLQVAPSLVVLLALVVFVCLVWFGWCGFLCAFPYWVATWFVTPSQLDSGDLSHSASTRAKKWAGKDGEVARLYATFARVKHS